MIAHGIWLGNRNKALCLCKQNQTESSSCSDHWNTLHIPITPCFRSDTEPPQKIAPVKPAWKYNCCNLWTEPIVWRPAWIQQNLLQNRDGEKAKKNPKKARNNHLGHSSPHPHKASWRRPSVWQPSLCLQPRGTLSVPKPPHQPNLMLWLGTTLAPTPSHSQRGCAALPPSLQGKGMDVAQSLLL